MHTTGKQIATQPTNIGTFHNVHGAISTCFEPSIIVSFELNVQLVFKYLKHITLSVLHTLISLDLVAVRNEKYTYNSSVERCEKIVLGR